MTTKSYLDNLENKGCIEAIPKDSKFIYRTTPKGIDLKERIEQFSASIYDYNLQSIERPNRRDCHRMHLGKNDK
jgi:DNA-binding HxlR family transcriptional regulator